MKTSSPVRASQKNCVAAILLATSLAICGSGLATGGGCDDPGNVGVCTTTRHSSNGTGTIYIPPPPPEPLPTAPESAARHPHATHLWAVRMLLWFNGLFR